MSLVPADYRTWIADDGELADRSLGPAAVVAGIAVQLEYGFEDQAIGSGDAELVSARLRSKNGPAGGAGECLVDYECRV